MTTYPLSDRTAILTGPPSNYNQALAHQLTEQGADLAFIHTEPEAFNSFVNMINDQREIHEKRGRAASIGFDPSRSGAVQDAVARAAEAFGGIDIYIDGVNFLKDPCSFTSPRTLEGWPEHFQMNLHYPFQITQHVIPYISSKKRGRIIYLIHENSLVGIGGNALLAATRGALTSLVKVLAHELSDQSVTANCVLMGTTEDYLLHHMESGEKIQETHERLKASLPSPALTEPEQIANLVSFLASPRGSALTGQIFTVRKGA